MPSMKPGLDTEPSRGGLDFLPLLQVWKPIEGGTSSVCSSIWLVQYLVNFYGVNLWSTLVFGKKLPRPGFIKMKDSLDFLGRQKKKKNQRNKP